MDILSLFLMLEYAILVFVDWARGLSGWGMPSEWVGTIIYTYYFEWIFWFLIPIVSMLLWRSWALKHPELVEEW